MSNNNIEELAVEVLELSKNHQHGKSDNKELLSKVQGLLNAVQSPMDHAVSLLTSMVEASTIKTLLSFNALQSIPASGSITLLELEKATGAQASLLERLLRVLLGTGFVTMNEDGTYSHTPLSRSYTGMMPGSLFSALYNELVTVALLPDYYKDGRPRREPDGDEATTHNPDSWKHRQEGKTAFEIMEQDPERLKQFQVLMAMAEHMRPFTGFYDYGKLADGVEEGRPVFVDVGGADGKTIAKILESHPKLKPEQCILQDREQTISLAKQNPALPKGVQCTVHDFFEPQPVKGVKAYHLRAICHDWSDTAVIQILKNIVPAMAPDSKVLIGDAVLPERGVTGMAACMDMLMLCIGGKERTRSGFEKVLDVAGLKLDGVWKAPGDVSFAVMEASLK